LGVLRNQEKALAFVVFEILNSFLNVLVSLILIVGFNLGWQGRAIGILFSICCFGLFGLLLLYKKKLIYFKIDFSSVKKILSISIPLIPHAIGGVIIVLSDRLFIERLVNKEAVGIYVVGCTFGLLVNLFVEAFSNAWSPWFYKQMTSDVDILKKKQRIVLFTYIYFACILLLAFCITAISQFILPIVVADEYQSASEFIFLVALGYAFRGMYTMFFPYFVFMGKTNFLGISTGVIALFNMALNYVLICKNGAIGAAQATLLSWFFMFLFSWIHSVRICRMPWLKCR
jgi:O-antigen/teichoic acid export membrane protein